MNLPDYTDQGIHDKYESQIKSLEAKINRLKHTVDEHSKTIFNVRNSGERLARSLGFNDIYEAQVAIDSADYSTTFQESFDRLRAAEEELATQKKDMEIIQNKLTTAEEAYKKIEHENRRISKEKAELEIRYDDMLSKKERAKDRYQADYIKWRDVYHKYNPCNYSSCKYEDAPGLEPEEQQRRMARIHDHRVRLMGMLAGPNATKVLNSPRIRKERGIDKENEKTPILTPRKRRYDSENSAPQSPARKTTTPTLPLRNTLLKSVTNMTAPSSSPTVSLTQSSTSSRVPLASQPIPDTIHIKEEPSSTPSPINSLQVSSPLSKPRTLSSSETEDDSQAIPIQLTDSQTGEVSTFKIPAPRTMAGPSHSGALSSSANLPPRPSIYDTSPRRALARSTDHAQPMRSREPLQLQQVDRESERPNKLRRLSENSHELSRNSSAMSNISTNSNSWSAPRPSAKGKERADDSAISTPLTARNLGQKRFEDYSAFKGRGRYGKAAKGPKQSTINALYTIDPAKNGGNNFQFEEVVRSKDERRKMNAGDCECCREYYENIGPLPSRLQQPMWRSPPNTPVKPCARQSHSLSPDSSRQAPLIIHGAAARLSEIESHKKTISRHRHNWARASTPPAYWDIGFPTTQEAGDINEKAKAMHERKKEQVAKEAASEGGRYRRK